MGRFLRLRPNSSDGIVTIVDWIFFVHVKALLGRRGHLSNVLWVCYMWSELTEFLHWRLQVIRVEDLVKTAEVPWYQPLDPDHFSLSSFRLTRLGRFFTRTMVSWFCIQAILLQDFDWVKPAMLIGYCHLVMAFWPTSFVWESFSSVYFLYALLACWKGSIVTFSVMLPLVFVSSRKTATGKLVYVICLASKHQTCLNRK